MSQALLGQRAAGLQGTSARIPRRPGRHSLQVCNNSRVDKFSKKDVMWGCQQNAESQGLKLGL